MNRRLYIVVRVMQVVTAGATLYSAAHQDLVGAILAGVSFSAFTAAREIMRHWRETP